MLYLQPLQNTVAREGQRIVLECSIAPYQSPETIQWYHNGDAIHNSPDYHISYNKGVCTLIIEEVFPEDAGKFTCTITVNGVSNSTFMFLRVEGNV